MSKKIADALGVDTYLLFIDDSKNKIIVQVSATCTKQKIEDSLSKNIFSKYAGYKYKFISISKEAGKLRENTFKNPHNMLFDPTEHIIDTVSILRMILNKSIDEQKLLYEFIKKELGTEIDIIKVDNGNNYFVSRNNNRDWYVVCEETKTSQRFSKRCQAKGMAIIMYKNDTVYYPYDEMTTVLLPVTSGCTYNKCAFCSMYKDDKYGEIPFSDIEMQLLNGYIYTEKVFLTGADPMAIGFDKMKRLLDMIHKYLPYCACVASYASIKNILKYSVEELSILHDMGLRLLYIGFETGRDDILKLMNKGHTVNEAIKQAKKLNEARITFNSIFMYGIAGVGEYVDNAVATAKMINQFITNKVITMNLIVFNGTELNNMVNRGDFIPPYRKERLVEIRTLLENLEPKQPMIFDTTHPTNIIKIKGTLPQDKNRLINEVTNYIKVLQ